MVVARAGYLWSTYEGEKYFAFKVKLRQKKQHKRRSYSVLIPKLYSS